MRESIPMRKKIIILIGIFLLMVAFSSLVFIAVISIFEGIGGVPVSFYRMGKPSIFIGIAYISVFLGVIVIFLAYIWQRVRALFLKYGQRNKKLL